ncbi:unnamed protein product [Brassicogethes aeneus]|uniref:Uncharacterized protein n=1 Tax=Brassicogethes aeneus TaxID=1431903 RepID=A0A9P0AZ55_BRAAE|nr:unnamed protein product [Brassicogethes aeneus]
MRIQQLLLYIIFLLYINMASGIIKKKSKKPYKQYLQPGNLEHMCSNVKKRLEKRHFPYISSQESYNPSEEQSVSPARSDFESYGDLKKKTTNENTSFNNNDLCDSYMWNSDKNGDIDNNDNTDDIDMCNNSTNSTYDNNDLDLGNEDKNGDIDNNGNTDEINMCNNSANSTYDNSDLDLDNDNTVYTADQMCNNDNNINGNIFQKYSDLNDTMFEKAGLTKFDVLAMIYSLSLKHQLSNTAREDIIELLKVCANLCNDDVFQSSNYYMAKFFEPSSQVSNYIFYCENCKSALTDPLVKECVQEQVVQCPNKKCNKEYQISLSKDYYFIIVNTTDQVADVLSQKYQRAKRTSDYYVEINTGDIVQVLKLIVVNKISYMYVKNVNCYKLMCENVQLPHIFEVESLSEYEHMIPIEHFTRKCIYVNIGEKSYICHFPNKNEVQ